jgi:DHA3 family macrolide efflux protein-like MFS transporter
MSALIGMGLAIIALGTTPASLAPWALVAIFAVGFTVPLANGPIQAVLQATVAPDFQGRVFTLYGTLATLATPVGLAAAAPLADLAGVRFWYLLAGAVCSVLGAAGIFIPSVANLDKLSARDCEDAA